MGINSSGGGLTRISRWGPFSNASSGREISDDDIKAKLISQRMPKWIKLSRWNVPLNPPHDPKKKFTLEKFWVHWDSFVLLDRISPIVAVNAVLHSPRPFNCRRCVLDVVLRAATKWVLVPLDLHIFSAGRNKSRKHSTAACARKVCPSTNSTHTPQALFPPTEKLEEIPLETEKKERIETSWELS